MELGTKFCIFCGLRPVEKTKEHVLPRWLIEMTGDPRRVVSFGCRIRTGEEITFSWSRFTFPACKDCNESHSGDEARAQKIVSQLLNKSPISCADYLHLLDWLDKVRIGLWLGYYFLHNNILGISPKFHINSRIGAKDRMVAIYLFESSVNGLNQHGGESLVFQLQPSCFSLRINDIYILNASWDFMCSARCGFPHPREPYINLENKGNLECSDLSLSREVESPILNRIIIKPSVYLFQPILPSPTSLTDYPKDNWLSKRIIEGSLSQGVLHRQFEDRVQVLEDSDSIVDYDEVVGVDCRPLNHIVAQTYELQNYSTFQYLYKPTESKKFDDVQEMFDAARQLNERIINAWKTR